MNATTSPTTPATPRLPELPEFTWADSDLPRAPGRVAVAVRDGSERLIHHFPASEKTTNRLRIALDRARALPEHPALVRPDELIVTDETVAIVYEHRRGRLLQDHLESGTRFETADVLALLNDVAGALATLHTGGKTILGLSPRHVLIGEDGRAALTLYLGSHDPIPAAGVLETAGELDLPQYRSPEQLRSELRALGPHCDVWSLGVIGLELLLGRPAFPARNRVDLMHHVAFHDPEGLESLAERSPAGLRDLFARALARAPEERYAAASGFQGDLGRLLRGEPIAPFKSEEALAPGYQLLIMLMLFVLLGLSGLGAWTVFRQYPG